MYTWTHPWVPRVSVTLDYDHYSDGRDYLSYALVSHGHTIFSGNDFSPSPLITDRLNEESVMHLLGFLTLQKGDTDDEYFREYTKSQLQWTARSPVADTLREIMYSWEDEKYNWEDENG